jgi:hypothetical protein
VPRLDRMGGGGEDVDEVVVQRPVLLGGQGEIGQADGDRVVAAERDDLDGVGEEVAGLVLDAAARLLAGVGGGPFSARNGRKGAVASTGR